MSVVGWHREGEHCHSHSMISQDVLAMVLYEQGRYDEAEDVIQSTFAWQQRVEGLEYPNTPLGTCHFTTIVLARGGLER